MKVETVVLKGGLQTEIIGTYIIMRVDNVTIVEIDTDGMTVTLGQLVKDTEGMLVMINWLMIMNRTEETTAMTDQVLWEVIKTFVIEVTVKKDKQAEHTVVTGIRLGQKRTGEVKPAELLPLPLQVALTIVKDKRHQQKIPRNQLAFSFYHRQRRQTL